MLQNDIFNVSTFARSSVSVYLVSSAVMAVLAPAGLKLACTIPFIAFALINMCWTQYLRNPTRVATLGQVKTFGAVYHTVGTASFSVILYLAMTDPELERGYLIMAGLLYGVLGIMMNIVNVCRVFKAYLGIMPPDQPRQHSGYPSL